MQFEFATANHICFGTDALQKIKSIAPVMGSKTCVLTGKHPERAGALIELLDEIGIQSFIFSVPAEPTIALIDEAVRFAGDQQADFVIAIGGGSVLDTGKALAAMLTNPGEVLDYLEVIGKGQPLRNPSVPFIAIPTTAGTGTEVTRNAVLKSEAHHVKVSMRSPWMLPTIAIVDPKLMLSVPKIVTAYTGLDALTQLIEPFVSNKSNPMTDAICQKGLEQVSASFVSAYEDGGHLQMREGMALASLFGGMALANAGLGAVHGIAGPLGGMCPVPHGAACAALLPHVMKMNLSQLRKKDMKVFIDRMNLIGRILTQSQNANAEDGIEWIRNLCDTIQIASLSEYGLTEKMIPDLVKKAKNASSMKGNPVVLPDQSIRRVIEDAF